MLSASMQAEEGGGGSDKPLWADAKPAVQEAPSEEGSSPSAHDAAAPQRPGCHEAHNCRHASLTQVWVTHSCVDLSHTTTIANFLVDTLCV